MPKLRPRARIVRTIGDQLISGPEAALIELVKNAFDADSPSIKITIVPPVDGQKEQGLIDVIDSGHGMSSKDVLEKWFEPATSDKVSRRISPTLERTMLGAKGVGRFATARLGNKLKLYTTSVRSGVKEVSEINIDWESFEEAIYLDQIDIDISSRSGKPSEECGVRLQISDLRDKWTKRQLELLVRELRRFSSPIRYREDAFKIYLDISAFTKEKHGFDGQSIISGLIESNEENEGFDPTEIRPFAIDKIFHYMVEGVFDKEGQFSGFFVNNRGDGKRQNINVSPTKMTTEEKGCGPINLRLNIYDREGEAIVELFEKLGLGSIGRNDAKNVLNENIGIGIYRGGFRIRPYGDAETDWLELERMRVQSPSRKLGLNQVWGLVEIGQEDTSGLIERSSREGLEHNGSFVRLKRLMTDLLAHVETIRYEFRQAAGLSRRVSTDTDTVKSKANMSATKRAIANLPVQYRNKVERAMKADSLALKTSIAELETYQQALSSRSTLGLVVAQILHDGRRFLSDITTRAKRLADGAPRLNEQSQFGDHFRGVFGKEANSIHHSSGQLSKLFKALDPISGRRRGRPKAFKVIEVINRCLGFFHDGMLDYDISVVFPDVNEVVEVVGYESDLMAALINIIDNAIHWLSVSPIEPRCLNFSIQMSKKYVKVSISNNGPIIADNYHSRLFSPSFTLKTEGSGIGLAIAREAMRASKGDVAFDPNMDQTTFVIEMLRAPK
ncbi:sensor histidine kinase [Pseudomonas cichorii]|uniref:sensor histidine kinase n=1 Tax=Pseudomonas cichorii TaxID=36746 RepID=UPI001C899883|nr:sensor histidine kinase [Pseudomonas cichorii]MBX8497213.1 ATP-binding protein [Pseudomonas cichorii]